MIAVCSDTVLMSEGLKGRPAVAGDEGATADCAMGAFEVAADKLGVDDVGIDVAVEETLDVASVVATVAEPALEDAVVIAATLSALVVDDEAELEEDVVVDAAASDTALVATVEANINEVEELDVSDTSVTIVEGATLLAMTAGAEFIAAMDGHDPAPHRH